MSPLTVMLTELGKELTRRGHVVEWACESRIPIIKYDLTFEGKTTFLTDFTKANHETNSSFVDYGHIMFPNYDRDTELGLTRPGRYNQESSKKILKYFDQIFMSSNPDFVIYENVSNSFAYAAYTAAKKHNKNYIGLIGSRIPGRFEIWPTPFGIQELIHREMSSEKKVCDPLTENLIKSWIDEKRPPIPDYMKNNPFSYKTKYIKHYIDKIKNDPKIIKKLLNPIAREEGRYAIQSPPLIDATLARLKRNIRRKLTLTQLDKLFTHPQPGEKYLIYPLHYHPESSTSVLSPEFVDEDAVIKNLAFNLPDGIMLYIKDHPNAAGFKKLSYYKRLYNLPNVRLIHYKHSTKSLLENSEGVVTLTSTMGFEALLHEKPVYCLGEAFYTPHKMCIKLTHASELKKAHETFTKQRPSSSRFHEENKRFVKAYYIQTHEGQLFTDRRSVTCDTITKVTNAIESHSNAALHKHPQHTP
ncbi:MAG: hypothetical protein ACOZAI_09315 [Pseudomonadota bacterium]